MCRDASFRIAHIKEFKRQCDKAKAEQKQNARKRQRLTDRLQGVSQADLMFALSQIAVAKG